MSDMPEVALWRAVIAQAINDATASVRPVKSKTSRSPQEAKHRMRKAIVLRDQARHWLLRDNKDFKRVCDLALLEPDAVREHAQRLARRDWVIQRPLRLDETLEAA